jgi:predicted nucleic acid-binding protein
LSSSVFLDTGAIYALADKNDLDHARVTRAYRESSRRFVTHQLILLETFSLITKRLHKHAALTTIAALRKSPRIEIVQAAPDLLENAWRRCEKYSDKDWDWIDCMSFELMVLHNVTEALTLDHHFTQAGFTSIVE